MTTLPASNTHRTLFPSHPKPTIQARLSHSTHRQCPTAPLQPHNDYTNLHTPHHTATAFLHLKTIISPFPKMHLVHARTQSQCHHERSLEHMGASVRSPFHCIPLPVKTTLLSSMPSAPFSGGRRRPLQIGSMLSRELLLVVRPEKY